MGIVQHGGALGTPRILGIIEAKMEVVFRIV